MTTGFPSVTEEQLFSVVYTKTIIHGLSVGESGRWLLPPLRRGRNNC